MDGDGIRNENESGTRTTRAGGDGAGADARPTAATRPTAGSPLDSFDRQRFALEAAGVGTWDWTFSSGVVRWSDTMGPIFGLERGSQIGGIEGLLELVHSEDRRALVASIERAIRTDGDFDVEFRIVCPDGNVRWCSGRGRVLRDETGEAVGMTGVNYDITERKNAVETLRRREDHYHFTLANTGTCTWERDFPAGTVHWSEETYSLFGIPTDVEPSHDVWESCLHPDDVEREREFFRSILENRLTSFDDEFRILHPTRGERWLLSRGAVEYAPDGTPLRMVGLNSDITDRKLAEEEAKHASEHVQRVLEGITDAFIALDTDWNFTYLNRHAEPHTGHSASSLVGRNLWEVFPDIRGTQTEHEYRRAAETQQPRHFVQYYPPNERWYEVSAYPYADGLSIFFSDITERKTWEEERERLLASERAALREATAANRRLELLADASRALYESLDYEQTLERLAALCVPAIADWCVIDIANESGRLERKAVAHSDPARTDWARAYARRHQAATHTAAGAAKVYATGESEYHPNVDDAALEAAASDEGHLQALRELRLRSVIVVPLATRDSTIGTLTLAYANSDRTYGPEDLTFAEEIARRAGIAVENARLYDRATILNEELEVRVQQRTLQLEQVNRELEAFSYSVSHDLRAPLRGLAGFSHALLEDYGEEFDDVARGYLNRIVAASERMGHLIDGLLHLSRVTRTELRRERVDLGAIAREVLDELRAEEPEREVRADVQPGLVVLGDSRMLRQVVQNLVGNAWKFTRGTDDARIEIGRDGDRIFVRDNGAGFDRTYVRRLFGAFQRLHSDAEFEGSGIGLALVQRIVHRHGGRIEADGEPGRGAVFSFTVPSSLVAGEADEVAS